VAIVVLSIVWMVRSARVGVELRDAGVVVRATFWTRTVPWTRIERAVVTPVRGRITLTLQLTGGRQRHVDELAATGAAAGIVVQAATEISRRLEARRP
jgi:hypothetical protein